MAEIKNIVTIRFISSFSADIMILLRLLSAAFILNLASYIHCQGQEIDIQINRKGDAILTVSWSVVENNTKF